MATAAKKAPAKKAVKKPVAKKPAKKAAKKASKKQQPSREIDPAEIAADAIAQDAVSDVPRMMFLMEQLQLAYEESKAKDDGGLAGAITSALAIQDYFVARRPDWNDAGLLNPMTQILMTLQALRDGGTSDILRANSHRINKQRLSTSDKTVRGYVSALVDLFMTRHSHSEDVACGKVSRALRSRGMPLGRGREDGAKDATTVKNWRKQASAGRVGVDPDATMYAQMKKYLMARTEPIDVLITEVLKDIAGIRPPIRKS